MAVFNTSGPAAPSQVSVLASDNPVIDNLTLTLAATEYSYVLPANTTKFRIQARGLTKLQFSYVSGQSGTVYATIHPLAYYSEDSLTLVSSRTIYIQSSQAGQVLEIIRWS